MSDDEPTPPPPAFLWAVLGALLVFGFVVAVRLMGPGAGL
jgi:hypothetical protein